MTLRDQGPIENVPCPQARSSKTLVPSPSTSFGYTATNGVVQRSSYEEV